MKCSKIKRAFNRLYNYLPNPIFKYPCKYYKIGMFLVEVAIADTLNSLSGGYGRECRLRWNGYRIQPWYIFDALFMSEGAWATVIEHTDKGYVKTNYSCKIDSKRDLNNLNKKLMSLSSLTGSF